MLLHLVLTFGIASGFVISVGLLARITHSNWSYHSNWSFVTWFCNRFCSFTNFNWSFVTWFCNRFCRSYQFQLVFCYLILQQFLQVLPISSGLLLPDFATDSAGLVISIGPLLVVFVTVSAGLVIFNGLVLPGISLSHFWLSLPGRGQKQWQLERQCQV